MFKSLSGNIFAVSLFFCLCLLLILLVTGASTKDNKKVSDQQLKQLHAIQKKYRSLTSLSVDFRQAVLSSGRMRQGEGSCIFYRSASDGPGVMRWNYNKPDTQIILNDGKNLSIYTQKDKQLLVTSAGDLQTDITYSFFSGNRNLLDDFNPLPPDLRFSTKADKKLLAVQLVPRKPHGQIKAVHLWFNKKFVLRKLVLEDHFDTVTELIFSKVTFDALPANSTATTEELVHLDLPPDTEVIKR